jgi:hypothetical protein
VVLFDLYKINVILTLQPQVIKFISCLPIAHGRWFSSGTPGSSTTKSGRHDIAEILLKVALKQQKSIKSNHHFNGRKFVLDNEVCKIHNHVFYAILLDTLLHLNLYYLITLHDI